MRLGNFSRLEIPTQNNQLTNKEALTVLFCVVKHLGSGQSTKEAEGETRDLGQVFLPAEFSSRFVSALQQTEQKGFFLCFMIKKPLNSSRITFYFSNKTIGRWRDSFSSVLILYSKLMHTFSTYQRAPSISKLESETPKLLAIKLKTLTKSLKNCMK